MPRRHIISALLVTILVIVGVLLLYRPKSGTKIESQKEEETVTDYTSINMAKAWEIFKTEGDYLIVDVRRPDEFAAGHIPNAINVPNETISDVEPAELPDKKQVIYVYCRSGRRSKEASEKLVALGYTHIIEFGGIISWPGAVVKD